MRARRLLSAASAVSLLMAGLSVPVVASAGSAAADTGPGAVSSQAQALAKARKTGQPVEIAALRGEAREVAANPDGTLTETDYLRPKWTRKNGAWAKVDTRLVKRSDGSLAPAASPLGVVIAGGEGPFVRMSRLGRELSLSWPGKLPAPSIEGDTAVFSSVLPDVDLRVQVEPDGISHLLVIKTPEAAHNPELAKIQLGLRTAKLTVKQDADGTLQASDSVSGAGMFEAPSPVMWDSRQPVVAARAEKAAGSGVGAPAPAQGPGDASAVAPVKVEVGSGKLALTPDQGLLTSPDTKFPVYVDPSWTARSRDAAWLMVSSGGWSRYKFSGSEGVGLCDVTKDAECGASTHKKRLFYRMPISEVAHKYVLNAEFTAFETHAYDCNNSTSVQLWHASGFAQSSTWNSTSDNWQEHLASRDVAYCSRTGVEFGGSSLLNVVKAAVSRGDPAITFGLRAYDESSMAWWKRFASDAYLRITYNTPPDRPLKSNLSSNPGGPCEWDDARPTVKAAPTIKAYLYDQDKEDAAKVTGQFQIWWNDGSGWAKHKDVTVGPKASGSPFETTVPADAPEGTLIGWAVRAYDGKQYSAWTNSGAPKMCEFILDKTKPSAPQVSSTDYPDDEADHGGVGQYGTFTFTPASSDVVKYQFAVNGSAKQGTTVQAPSPGVPVTVSIMPTSEGPNTLSVISYDKAGNDSEPASYTFKSGPGAPAKARFTLDDPAGASSVQAATRDGEPGIAAATHGGVTLGADGQIGKAMQLNGSTGYAATSAPVLDTTKSFSVSAWVRLDNKNNTGVVAAQDGTRGSAFALYYSPGYDRWVFNMQDPGTDNPALIRAISTASPATGQWTHLVGVYDHAAHKIHLYVNGSLQASTDQPNSFSGDGPLQIGRFKWNGGYGSGYYWPGALDEVGLYDRVVTGAEVLSAYQRAPVVMARWKLNTDGADDSGHGRTLSLAGGASIDGAAGYLGDPMAGLLLDGQAGSYAATAAPVLSTGDSFTVAGWVATPGSTGDAAVFSQAGITNSAFTLRYSPAAANNTGGWQIEMPDADKTGAAFNTAEHATFFPGQWQHLAIVYDAPNQEMRLYVNGELQETDPVSWKSGISGFASAGGLQLGRARKNGAWGQFFNGTIDDVWAFKGVATADQLQILSNAFEELPTETVP
ncbi:LamG domain-containing protein [Actinomadura opuntiae]|uniref:LamG domain-containing protein n=1 Tax=Actinomadura sp. OS1-43 TaxID=604315 RepID=UPI00255B350B|nr:LamG domain-containing protein [Actinomadura sp. OS1-43]MDL4813186.1 LamG domain-containing protein [Actinomadura sp. OS1-43]